MNKKFEELIMLTLTVTFQRENLEKIVNVLKEIFDADEVKVNPTAILDKNNNALHLPIIINKKVCAYYEIINPKNTLSKDEINFIDQILSLMHNNINQYEQQMENFKLDKNTGLYNKNYFLEYVKNFDSKSVKNLSCIFIDVNGLREINNIYGHEAGDIMLKRVAECINTVFNRDTDIAFRYGGDEFVIFIANQLSNNIKIRLDYFKGLLENDDINVACGLASDYGDIDINRLIELADKNMYADKNMFYQNKSYRK